jgi:hypothetical protein
MEVRIIDISLADAARSFVESCRTTEAPSFKAMVPIGSFSVSKVLVKRVFTTSANGVEFRLTEVHDMMIESVCSTRVLLDHQVKS